MNGIKYLPIGSVVLLEGGTKTLMITGYNMKEKEDSEKVYDYVGCAFPEGFMEEIFALFDDKQIQNVLFVGCMDGENEYLGSIEQKMSSGEMFDVDNSNSDKAKAARRAARKKAPSKPLSASEMKARFTRKVISGGQTKVFEIEDYDPSDFKVWDDDGGMK